MTIREFDEGTEMTDRRHVGMLKDVLTPGLVNIISVAIGAAISGYISLQLLEQRFNILERDQAIQRLLNDKIVEAIKSLEVGNARQDERNKAESLLIRRLQDATDSRYTSADAVRDLTPLDYRMRLIEETVSQIRSRLNTSRQEINNENNN